MYTTTVCFLLRGAAPQEVLLGYKKRGFGAGKITGIGGRVETGETILAAACRELAEEIGVAVDEPHLQAMGAVTFYFPQRHTWNQRVHIFVVTEWRGEPRESEEIRPVWHSIDALPIARMWDDSRYWLPQVLAGQPIQAQITFADDCATVQAAKIA